MSLRQLAARAGVSNPYLSQVERGLRRPSADVLQQLARALEISAAALYTRAGLLDESAHPDGDLPAAVHLPDRGHAPTSPGSSPVVAAVLADDALDDRQRRILIDVYSAFVGAGSAPARPVDRLPTEEEIS